MADINWGAIHAAYADYKAKKGQPIRASVPQPQENTPMHNMIIHAMAMHPNKDGETQGVMVIRALSDHLKRVTPDVSALHKPKNDGSPATSELAPAPRVATSQ